jgi:hypothetical protein
MRAVMAALLATFFVAISLTASIFVAQRPRNSMISQEFLSSLLDFPLWDRDFANPSDAGSKCPRRTQAAPVLLPA